MNPDIISYQDINTELIYNTVYNDTLQYDNDSNTSFTGKIDFDGISYTAKEIGELLKIVSKLKKIYPEIFVG